jgi:hypothetical protein
VNDFTRTYGLDGFEQLGKNRSEILDIGPARRRRQDQTSVWRDSAVLQILVDGNQDIEALLRQGYQLAVGDANPTHRLYRLDFMVGKCFDDAWIDAFV